MMFDTFDRNGNAEFNFHKRVVFRAVSAAVKELKGMTIERSDELASRLDVKTGISAMSWGEKISVSVAGNGENAAVVSIQSGAKTIFGSATTHGKNRENVKQIIRRTSELLAQHAAQWQKDLGLDSKTQVLKSDAGQSTPSIADEISKLAALLNQGLLTPEEFTEQKARLLGRN